MRKSMGKPVKVRFAMRKIIFLYFRYYDFASNRYEIGGIETYIRNLCEVASACGCEPHVLIPIQGAIDDRVLAAGEEVHLVKCVPGDVHPLVAEAYRIGNAQEDVLVFATSTMIEKTKFNHTVGIQHGIYWDTTSIHGQEFTGRNVSTAARAVQAKSILNQHSLVSRMVCVDLNYVNWMRALSVANRLPYTYIPNFADTSIAVPERKSDGKVRVVFARRFEAIRGCELLIDVMPRLLREHPEVELTIAGDGSLEGELHKAFDGGGRVKFTRYDAWESIAFHGRFDIALVPSVASEGTSLSLLEAMSAGCAVVATDIGGMSNIVLSGHNGLLVRPEADDLYRSVSRLVRDIELRTRLSRNARRTVEDSFSRERWAESWTEVLKELS